MQGFGIDRGEKPPRGFGESAIPPFGGPFPWWFPVVTAMGLGVMRHTGTKWEAETSHFTPRGAGASWVLPERCETGKACPARGGDRAAQARGRLGVLTEINYQKLMAQRQPGTVKGMAGAAAGGGLGSTLTSCQV